MPPPDGGISPGLARLSECHTTAQVSRPSSIPATHPSREESRHYSREVLFRRIKSALRPESCECLRHASDIASSPRLP